MTKADIVNSVSNATGLTKVETEAVLEGVIKSIVNSLNFKHWENTGNYIATKAHKLTALLETGNLFVYLMEVNTSLMSDQNNNY